jgi:hypothetical protein
MLVTVKLSREVVEKISEIKKELGLKSYTRVLEDLLNVENKKRANYKKQILNIISNKS